MINLHYGPDRMQNLIIKGFAGNLLFDHPFGRRMPEEVVEKVDEFVRDRVVKDVVLVEEYPLIYLRYLIRKGDLRSDQVHVYWHDGDARELRLGEQGEFLDPWPTGYFDRSLEFVLGAWDNGE